VPNLTSTLTPLPPEVLIALPVSGFVGGTLVACGIANYLLRAMLGTTLRFVAGAIAVLLTMLILGSRVVSSTTRLLYRHATEQARLAARFSRE
jgi:hypothetical protein